MKDNKTLDAGRLLFNTPASRLPCLSAEMGVMLLDTKRKSLSLYWAPSEYCTDCEILPASVSFRNVFRRMSLFACFHGGRRPPAVGGLSQRTRGRHLIVGITKRIRCRETNNYNNNNTASLEQQQQQHQPQQRSIVIPYGSIIPSTEQRIILETHITYFYTWYI